MLFTEEEILDEVAEEDVDNQENDKEMHTVKLVKHEKAAKCFGTTGSEFHLKLLFSHNLHSHSDAKKEHTKAKLCTCMELLTHTPNMVKERF